MSSLKQTNYRDIVSDIVLLLNRVFHDSSLCFATYQLTIIVTFLFQSAKLRRRIRTGLVQRCNLQARCPVWSLGLLRRAILISYPAIQLAVCLRMVVSIKVQAFRARHFVCLNQLALKWVSMCWLRDMIRAQYFFCGPWFELLFPSLLPILLRCDDTLFCTVRSFDWNGTRQHILARCPPWSLELVQSNFLFASVWQF